MRPIDEFFRGIDAGERRCFLRVSALRDLVDRTDVLRALAEQLEVPGKATLLRSLNDDELFDAISQQIDGLRNRKTSVWFGARGGEVLAASIFRGVIGRDSPSWRKIRRDVEAAFGMVRLESDLRRPVSRWLTGGALEVFDEVPMGTKVADLLGVRDTARLFGMVRDLHIVSVELKNELSQMKRGLDQLATFQEYSTQTYLACTPYFAAQVLDHHAQGKEVRHWDPELLHRRLSAVGCGLLAVEGGEVFEVIAPARRKVDERRLAEVWAALKKRP